ncbi:hypothetical protein BD779DRAFT_1545266 [Infundibulicybe gibba]|nr:hypothetical protein BD779DRAFT_1545266 [Infundibulicybe gibba]
MSALTRTTLPNRSAVQEGLKIVRRVVSANQNPNGLTTAEIFKFAIKEEIPVGFKHELSSIRSTIPSNGKGQKSALPMPPHPEHPIKSMSFLKKSILPILEGHKELEIVRTARIPFNPSPIRANQVKRKGKEAANAASAASAPAPVTVWAWKPVDPTTIPKPQPPKAPIKTFGTEVGVGEDWSHLSKRRQRARVGKVWRDVATMKSLAAEKKQQVLDQAERNRLLNLKRRRQPVEIAKEV